MDSNVSHHVADAGEESWIRIAYAQLLTGISLIGAEVLYRALTASYEYIVHWKHYPPNRRLLSVCTYALAKSHVRTYYMLPVLIIVLFLIQRNDDSAWEYIFKSFNVISLPYIVLRILCFTYTNVELARWIRSGSGLDYGTGMASNYFHGYLHLELPETGHQTKGLTERIQDYEDTEGVYIPIKKLFILIPQSLHTKPKIQSSSMHAVKHLETVILDRAGVKRPFKNAVYRVSGCGPERNLTWYVVLEGATPMMSFYEGLTYRLTCTGEMYDMKREITLQFYRALKKIVTNCPDTKDLVELVYYNDTTAEGDDVDVGEVVKERLQTLVSKSGLPLK